MGVKSFIPGTAAYSEKHFVKYLHKKARGHDVMLLIEWDDNKITEMPADYHADKDGWYVTPPGLMFANVGEGVDPVSFHGVQTIRCHAGIACPISTTAAIQSEYEECGEFEVVADDNDRSKKVIEITPADENGHGNGEAMADGGAARREYKIRPPAPAVGHAFGLEEVKQRAPNPVNPNMIRRAYEFGKQKARDQGRVLKIAAIALGVGLALALTVMGFIWLLNQLGSGGGGGGGDGGGGTVLSILSLLLAAPNRDMLRRRVTNFIATSEEG
ncbi:hypothetical protein [Haloarcula rubripromontorii]|uniref:hypothetical protein n=1 Tax=Haloarcula rubripromontorii TaxID=1705562 RepID=UPI00345B8A93